MDKLVKIIFVILLAFGLHKLNNNIKLPVKNFESKIYLNPQFKHLALGFKKFFSSLLWINTLLDGDLTHYKGKDLKSWMFLRFDTITDLDPFFIEAYRFGSLYLSVVKDDIKGASKIFAKGLSYFPSDFKLNMYGAYHSLYEENDETTAAQRLSLIRSQLSKSPLAIAMLYSLRAKRTNDYSKLQEIVEMIRNDSDLSESIKKRLIEKILK